MGFLVSLLKDLTILVPTSLICAIVTAVLIWRCRAWGLWALLWCLVMEIVFVVLASALTPGMMRYRDPQDGGITPLPMGIGLGCLWPAIGILTRHLSTRQKR